MDNTDSGGRTWFTSDLHFGHPLVSRVRGFGESTTAIARHDELLMANLRNALRSGDTLWILGDISSGWRAHEEQALDFLDATLRQDDSLDITMHLISGNHDSSHPLHPHAPERQRRFLEVFDSVNPMQVLYWDKEPVWLSHFPRPGQDHIGPDSRHDEIRLTAPLLIHGHLHSKDPITGEGQVDVGVDPWGFRPVLEEEVMDNLFNGSGWRR